MVSPSRLLPLLMAVGCGGRAEIVEHAEPLLQQAGPPNILFLLLDDVGVDQIAAYGSTDDPAHTPVIDGLAAEGMRFERAWTNPTCSPTRAAVLTGQHAYRTGIGVVIQPQEDVWTLSHDTWTLPKALAEAPVPYASAAVGKWHLGTWLGTDGRDPLDHGFGHHAGSLANLVQHQSHDAAEQSYTDWELSVDGEVARTTAYATTHTVDAALAAIDEMPEPWLGWVAFNAGHSPYHVPPEALWSGGPTETRRQKYQAMLESLDTEIGRLLEGLDPNERARTVVIVMGDNGTPGGVTAPPLSDDRAKATIYEGGVRVPLIVSGVPVRHPGSRSTALVNHTDVYATVAELAGLAPDHRALLAAVDSVSFAPVLADETLPGARQTIYTERFRPNGFGPYSMHDRAIRDARYKLITRIDGSKEFYALGDDWLEGEDLLQRALTAAERKALYELEAQMPEIGGG